LFDESTSYGCRNVVLRNVGNGRFIDVTDKCGDLAKLRMSGRGVAFDDLDNDGRIDVVVLNPNDKPTILSQYSSARGRIRELGRTVDNWGKIE